MYASKEVMKGIIAVNHAVSAKIDCSLPITTLPQPHA